MILSRFNLGWVDISGYKNYFLFKVHAIWLIVIPLLGKVIGFFFDKKLLLSHTCPPRMWLILYLLSLMIMLARVCFEIRCPRLIKQCNTFCLFDSMNLSQGYIRDQLYEFMPKDEVDREFGLNFNTQESPYQKSYKNLEKYYYDSLALLNRQRVYSRLFINGCYFFSFLLVIYYVLGNVVCFFLSQA